MITQPKGKRGYAQSIIAPLAVEKLKRMGYSGITEKDISTKNYLNYTSPAYVLLKDNEFSGKLFYVLTDRTWIGLSDTFGNFIKDVDEITVDDIEIYNLPPTPGYKTKYEEITFDSSPTDVSYKVFIEDLNKVEVKSVIKSKTISKPEEPTLFDDLKDEHINAMTIRDFYSIVQSVPASNKEWLNDIIKKTNIIKNDSRRN